MMQTFCFEKDTVFHLGGSPWVITRIVRHPQHPSDVLRNSICFENMMTGLFDQKPLVELLEMFRDGQLSIGHDIVHSEPTDQESVRQTGKRHTGNIRSEDMEDAKRRQGYLKAILDAGPWRNDDTYLKEKTYRHSLLSGDKQPPSIGSIKCWYRRLKRSGFDWESLIPRTNRKGNRRPRIKATVLDFYLAVLKKRYLTEQRASLKGVYDDLEIEIGVHNEKFPDDPMALPSLATLYRLKNSIPAYDRKRARHGRHAANLEFRRGMPWEPASQILEVVETDHTPIDIVVVCPDTGVVLGAPWLTTLIDSYSRMPIGLHVSLGNPCMQSVVNALQHAINPKSYLPTQYPQVKGSWPAYGKIDRLVCDNGAEFHTKELEDMGLLLGMEIQFCPSRAPYFKGKIERFQKTFNHGLIHSLPGTRFSNYTEAGDYDTEGKAVLTFKTLMTIIHIWFVDIYMVSNHRGIDDTPLNRWIKSAEIRPPRLPHSTSQLKQTLMRMTTRKLRTQGIEIFKLHYNNEALFDLRKAIGNGHDLQVRYDANDLGHIYVQHPVTTDLIQVESVIPEYAAGLSLPMHKAILLHRKSMRDTREDRAALLAAKMEIASLVESDRKSLKKVRRKKVEKIIGTSSESVINRKKLPIGDRMPLGADTDSIFDAPVADFLQMTAD